MSTLSHEIANLSPEKRAALQKLLQKRQAEQQQVQLPQIGAVPRDREHYPLSSAEQRLWFLDRFSDTEAAFNLHAALELDGPLDGAALAASFRRLVERHETLRTRYVMLDGEPRRVLEASVDVQLQQIDLQGLDGDAQEAEVQRRTRAHAHQHFPLERGGLIAAALLRLDAERHVLLFAMHHIVSDGWSLTLMLDELWDGYAAILQGRAPQPPSAVQYLDYAVWQQDALATPRLERQVDYWRRQLDAAPDLLELPTDRARPATQTYAGHEIQFRIPAALLANLKQSGRSANASLFMVALTAYVALLARWSGQTDIVVGTDVANRNHAELEPLIGFFVNQLALRCRFDAETDLAELLRHVRGVCLEAFANQDVPFNHLVDRLQIARDPSRTPVFQAKFMLQNTPDARDDGGSPLTATMIERIEDTSQFDVLLALKETADGGARGSLRYRTDLFDAATAQRWVAHYLALLDLLVAEPTRTLGRIAWLSADERSLLARLNDSRTKLPFEALPIAFARAAAAHADAMALACSETSLSYRELHDRSDRLAARLLQLGVTAEQPVAVCMARSVDMVVALLAVLRSGACYVPLDPDYGAERLAYVLDDCGARYVLCDDDAVQLPQQVTRLVLDRGWQERDDAPAPAAWPQPLRDQLAYIIYTSGSTGRPKGVAVRHGGLSNFLASMRAETGMSASDRLLAVTTVAFDIAALELYLPLLCGASIVLATREEAQDGRRLHGLVHARDISVLQATPSTWRALLAAARDTPLPLLGLCGGEALPQELAVQLLAAGVRLVNVYGPTETTIWSSLGEVTAAQVRELANAPLGRPLANTTLHVLDRAGQPVPIGVPGELCIGGEGLARGYCNKPALTAAAFVPDPFGSTPGARLYRTGDVVRWLSDGRLAFLGRQDHQVKVRGYRIELGEIESVLGAHPSVANAVVVTRPDTLGSAVLVAYLQARCENVDIDAVLQHAAAFLPRYMLPNELHCLEHLPLTPNGKVDRKALALAASERAATPDIASGTAPADALERDIAAVWQAVLGVTAVHMEQDFFRSGGHSLLAVQLLDRIERACRVELPLHAFFRQPTPAGIVACVREQANARREVSQHAQIVADAAAASEPFPLTSIQQAYWLGRSGSFELGNIATQNYLEIDIRDFDPARFTTAWNTLVRRHAMLRAVFADDGTQRILPQLPEHVPTLLDLRGSDNAEEQLLALRLRMKSQVLPAATGPLFDLRYSRIDEARWRVHFCIDMLISDVVSNHILFGELDRLYREPDAALPPLSIGFRDYVLAEQALLASPKFERARRYWLDRAPTFPGRPDLPLARDPSRLSEQTFSRRRWTLPAAQWLALKQRGQSLRVSPTVLVLTAFGEVLGTWSKDPRFALNLTLFNRMPLHPDVEHLVGDFTSSLLLELEHGPGLGFEQRAVALQARLWQDLDHKLFSGVDMIRELARARGGTQGASMPVVFTSILGLDTPGQTPSEDEARNAEEGYSASQTSQVWLDHQVAEQNGALTLVWDALDAVFPDGMLDAMFAVYTQRLRELADDADSWHRLPRLMPAEQRTRRDAINHVPVPLTDDCLHTLFERQAAATPDAIAIRTPTRAIDYRTLDRWSDALASALIEAGAGRGGLVAIVMHKGWEQIVAAMAIVKSGAAYMPVDADLPPQRRAQVIEEGGARIALLQTGSDVSHEGLRTLVIDDVMLDALPPRKPAALPTADDIAYVIFTSGSTGKPKGVVIDHRGAVNTVLDINRRFDVRAGDGVLALSSLSFDLSVYDIFGLLAIGGTVVLPTAGRQDSAAHWWDCIVDCGVTVWNTVPALMQLLVDHCERLEPAGLGPLRVVMMSGDWIPVTLPGRIRALSPAAEIYSLGGATEASIWSIYHPIVEPAPELRSVPYGKPLGNQSFHVLDMALEPRPDGVTGMLYIGGIGLAKGYWRDPVRTALSFVAGPSGERLYRTGDLGRYLPDGNIEFLGREDSQVKVQGYRIELGDIEAALQGHPAIGAAAVNAIGEHQDSKTLVAYVVARGATEADDGRITDPQQRSLFKLEQRGLRRLDAALPRVHLHASRLGELLQGVRPITLADDPLPKYRYPSASSLYPVQLYVAVPPSAADAWTLAPGFYYHEASSHTLVRLADATPFAATDDGHLQFHLVADPAAIEPMYSSDEARRFCELEAGYLSTLLADDADAAGLTIQTQWRDLDIDTECMPRDARLLASMMLRPTSNRAQAATVCSGIARAGAIALPASDTAAVPYDALQRQSFRRYADRPCTPEQLATVLALASVQPCDTFVHVQRCDALASGWYRYITKEHALLPVHADTAPRTLFNDANAAIAAAAAFAVFIVGERRSVALGDVGAAGQRLMARCWRAGVGVCPIGAVQDQPTLFGYGVEVLHAFVGGVIDPSRTTQREADDTPHAELTPEALAEYLSARLPAYMVPRVYVGLDALPLSANGKVDRKALPRPDLQRKDKAGHAPPRTATETLLASLWQTLLKVERVGRNDAFFELGGNSLVAMQLSSRLRIDHGIDLSLRQIFEHATLADLAAAIAPATTAAPAIDIHALRAQWLATQPAGDSHVLFPLTLAQRHLFAHQQLDPNATAYNIPTALPIDASIDPSAIGAALQRVVDRHEALRTRFAYRDGDVWQRVDHRQAVDFAVVDLTAMAGDAARAEADRLVQSDAARPFDLFAGPLLRARVIRVDADTSVMMINVHHIIADYLSMEILVAELGAAHGPAAPERPPLPLHFADAALWERAFLASPEATRQREHWQQALRDVPRLDLPAVAAGPDGWQGFHIDGDLLARLRTRCRNLDVTVFMLGFAAVHQLMASHCGQDDFAIGTPISTRRVPELEPCIGLLLNTLPIRLGTPTTHSGEALLRDTRTQCMQAFDHSDYPYEGVVAALRQQRPDAADEQPYRVRYVYRRIDAATADNAAAQPEIRRSQAKFDLLITLNESDDHAFGEIEYRGDAIDGDTVSLLCSQIVPLLAWLADNTQDTLADLHAQLAIRREAHRAAQRSARSSKLADRLKQLRR